MRTYYYTNNILSGYRHGTAILLNSDTCIEIGNACPPFIECF